MWTSKTRKFLSILGWYLESNRFVRLCEQARIVGGVTTDVNEFPFMCGIMDLTTKRVICGCTIIHEQYVITSAHCVVNQSMSDLGCIVGAQDYVMQSSSPYTSIYRFAGFIPYPSYDPTSLVNDIAIMRIYGSMQFNAGVSAVCLPIRFVCCLSQAKSNAFNQSNSLRFWCTTLFSSDRLNQNTFVYSQAEAVGWGKTSYGGPVSTNLQKVELTVIPNNECTKNYPYQISTAQICTFSPMKDVCDVSMLHPAPFFSCNSHFLIFCTLFSLSLSFSNF